MNFSREQSFIKRTDQPPQPILETGPKKEIISPEPWLNIKREQDYLVLISSLEKMNPKEQIAWLGLVLETDFTEAEAENISVRIVESADSSQIANYPIKRPVIECATQEGVALLATKIGHAQPEKVGGFNLVGGRLIKKGLGEVDIIVSTKNSGTTQHEIRHSIEPKIRAGMERALSEIFAYAGQYIKTGDWQGLEKSVTDELYFDAYKTGLNDIAPEQRETFTADEKALFFKEVHQAVEQLKKRTMEIGEISALRELIITGSLVEYTDEEFRKRKAEMAKLKIR